MNTKLRNTAAALLAAAASLAAQTLTVLPATTPGEILVQNTGAEPISGEIALTVSGAVVANRQAIVRGPNGRPAYRVAVDAGRDGVLSPGEVGRAVPDSRGDAQATAGGGAIVPARNDVNGDGISDAVFFSPSTRRFSARLSNSGQTIPLGTVPGGSNLRPVTGDSDGDGRADVGVYDAAAGTWVWRSSASGAWSTTHFPVPPGARVAAGDVDGDGLADLAFYRSGTAEFVYRSSRNGAVLTVGLGTPNVSRPAQADFDGDGVVDLAVWNPAARAVHYRSSQTQTEQTVAICGGNGNDSICGGNGNDSFLPADYDGDGRADLAFFRPSTGELAVRMSSGGPVSVIRLQYGTTGTGRTLTTLVSQMSTDGGGWTLVIKDPPWDITSDPLGIIVDPDRGLTTDPLGIESDPFGITSDPLGITSDPLGITSDPLGISTGRFDLGVTGGLQIQARTAVNVIR
jgi:hypothetical protein